MKNAVRKPTEAEVSELVALTLKRFGTDNEAQDQQIWQRLAQAAYIAVYDQYVSGGSGYVGKVMSVIWDGSPNQYEVYVWNNGKIERQRHEMACENSDY